MAPPDYPYIDIVVLDAIRTRVARGDAMVVLTPDLSSVVWANGSGAALFGAGDLESFLGSDPTLGAPVRRQIETAVAARRKGRASVRLARGFSSRVVGCEVERIALPHGEAAILLAVKADSASEVRAAVTGGFSTPGTHIALLDGQGDTIVADSGFSGLAIAPAQIRELIRQVRGEADRLVKRPLQTARGDLPAAIARLSERPDRHLLMIIEDAGLDADAPEDAPAPREEEPQAVAPQPPEIIAAPPLAPADDEPADDAPEPEAGADGPGDDHDSWYFEQDSERLVPANDRGPARPALEDISADDEPEQREPAGDLDDSGEDNDAGGDFVHDPQSGPVRFVWKTAPDGTFRDISDEFAQAVGPRAADIVGQTFEDVAARFDLDPSGEIGQLMLRRDTWSGRSVLWPIQGTDLKVPVDLAALPVYDRERNFNGFRGFGVARMSDAMIDPDATGLSLGAAPKPQASRPAEPDPEPEASETEPSAGDTDKVIDLGSRRRGRAEGNLSETEASAFRTIGEKLRSDTGDEAETGAGEDTEPPQNDAGDAKSDAPEPADAPAAKDDRVSRVAANAPPIVREGFLPSAFARGDGPGHATLDEDVLSVLPIAILVHDSKSIHYVNDEFLRLTGYRSLEAFRKAGGLDVLFADSDEPVTPRFGAPVRLVRVEGDMVPVEARLHSVRWRDTVSLLLSMRPLDDAEEPDDAAPAENAQAPAIVRPEPEPEPAQAMQSGPAAETPQDADGDAAAEARELRAILDTATDGVVLLDNQGRIRSLNRSAEALFGYDGTEMAGEPFQMLFAIESRPAANDYLQSLSDNGITSLLNDGRELTAREKQGRFIPVFMTMGRLQESNGFCAVLRDITQFKRTEMELEQARKKAEAASDQKSEFLARVSHEVRTPLNAIIGFSEIMLAESYGPIGNERYRDYLADINTSGNHVLQLINDLLDISKIEAGQQDLDYEAVPLNDVISECVSIMQPAANRERVIVRTSLSPSVPDVVADMRSMRQIVLNLLSNAIRYTQSGGQIIVSTTYDGNGEVAMRVRDTGIGMSDAEIEQAMKPFKQVPAAKSRASGGTGLGLPLTKAMTEANRALFSIRSTPGEGTVVSVVFPPQRVLAD